MGCFVGLPSSSPHAPSGLLPRSCPSCCSLPDWFKAGKGPDPKVASLDRGLDSYWSKAGEKTNGDAAAGDNMEDTEAPAPAVVAPVAGVDPDL